MSPPQRTAQVRSRAGIRTVPIPDSAIWLDMTRIYAEAYEQATIGASAGARAAADREAGTEFGTGSDGGDGGGA